MTTAALSMRGIVKAFPGVRALDCARLELRSGEVHGLVGENGAGKSTMIKVLAGIHRPEEGTVFVGNRAMNPITPETIHASGVRFIHQELHLVTHFTVWESVFLGQELSGRFGLAKREMRRRAEAFLSDTLGVDLPGDRLIRDLGTSERKLVQIARALIDQKAKVVVFDEPTAHLNHDEVDVVMGAVAALKAQGVAILYVSHYLAEITAVSDRVTVLRQGRTVAVFDNITHESGEELVFSMVGRDIADIFPARNRTPSAVALKTVALTGKGFEAVSLSLRKGEVLGIAGLIGSGRYALIDALYGLEPAKAGEIRLDGRTVKLRSPAQAVKRGIVLVPRDRRHDGLVLPMTVAENITLATLEKHSRAGFSDRGRESSTARALIAALDIRPPNPDAITRFSSGGNQQKIVLARWIAKRAGVLLFDEPTIGVDIAARSEIYRLIESLVRDGAAVIISSGDPEELVGVCDRVAVMMRGRIVATLAGESLDVDRLVAATTGATPDRGTSHAT